MHKWAAAQHTSERNKAQKFYCQYTLGERSLARTWALLCKSTFCLAITWQICLLFQISVIILCCIKIASLKNRNNQPSVCFTITCIVIKLRVQQDCFTISIPQWHNCANICPNILCLNTVFIPLSLSPSGFSFRVSGALLVKAACSSTSSVAKSHTEAIIWLLLLLRINRSEWGWGKMLYINPAKFISWNGWSLGLCAGIFPSNFL